MKVEQRSLTTGEIASYCGVNLRTVIRWLESGRLNGYKLPGGGNNRILVEDFVGFLKQNKMPIPADVASEVKREEEPLILIVDDEISMAKAIQRNARKAGVRSLIAEDGFQAGMMLSSHKPQMMTLDLSMPGLDGYEVLRFTRAQDDFKNMKIIVISALDPKKLNEAIALGADKVLSKPFDPAELQAEFESLYT
jgi:excisionase family DNA binding protein